MHLKAITKYWFSEDFNLFRKPNKLNMMKICKIMEMDNIEKNNLIEILDKDSSTRVKEFITDNLLKLV